MPLKKASRHHGIEASRGEKKALGIRHTGRHRAACFAGGLEEEKVSEEEKGGKGEEEKVSG